MTAIITGIAAVANVQGAEATARSEFVDTAYHANDLSDRPNAAAAISATTRDADASVNQPLPTGSAGKNPGNGEQKKHFGIGGGPIPGVIALDLTPIKEFIRVNPVLSGKTFPMHHDSRYNRFFTMGGMGYVHVGNGVLLGGGGAGGERRYLSDRFAQDSAIMLSVKAEYGGFIVEKVFDRRSYSFHTGMQIGGGSLRVKYHAEDGSAFHASNTSYDANTDRENVAPFNLFEVHGGLTYSLTSFVHIGADVAVPMFYSAMGFNTHTSEFATVNPAFAFRLLLGNKG
jgi:hypothetical protein